jgi:hypothetical protein
MPRRVVSGARLGGSPMRTEATKWTGPGHASQRVLQRQPVLAQREVEGRALERPSPVQAGALADRLHWEQLRQPDQPRELVEGAPSALPRQVPGIAKELQVIDLIPRDVLALPLVSASDQADDDGDLREPAGGVADQRPQVAALDRERQLSDARVRGHWRRACSRLRQRSRWRERRVNSASAHHYWERG